MAGLPSAAVTDVSASEEGVLTIEYSYSSGSPFEEDVDVSQEKQGAAAEKQPSLEPSSASLPPTLPTSEQEGNKGETKHGNLRGTPGPLDVFNVAAVYSATELLLDPRCDASSPKAHAAMDEAAQVGYIKFPLRVPAAATTAAPLGVTETGLGDESAALPTLPAPSAAPSAAAPSAAAVDKATLVRSHSPAAETTLLLDRPASVAVEAVERRNAHRLPIVTMNEF
eukprot:GHVT01031698.1.p1 GENE.GHVT01031698.1~~GHVT01031698.1.p1  ORF type:complete len:225 (-),score=70.99 GHVT01031698.1:747-1421(-)